MPALENSLHQPAIGSVKSELDDPRDVPLSFVPDCQANHCPLHDILQCKDAGPYAVLQRVEGPHSKKGRYSRWISFDAKRRRNEVRDLCTVQSSSLRWGETQCRSTLGEVRTNSMKRSPFGRGNASRTFATSSPDKGLYHCCVQVLLRGSIKEINILPVIPIRYGAKYPKYRGLILCSRHSER